MLERFKCPCCGFPTLKDRGMYEVCILCDWEDDGTEDIELIVGGPNGDISLFEARNNFVDHLDMYPHSNLIYVYPSIHKKELDLKNKLIELFKQLGNCINEKEINNTWKEIFSLEEELKLVMDNYLSRLDESYRKHKMIVEDINSTEPDKVVHGLLGLVERCDDLEYVQRYCLIFSRSTNFNIRGIAILCFGHLARLHMKLSLSLVLPIVEQALKDENKFVRGHAYSALDDIRMFCNDDWQGDV